MTRTRTARAGARALLAALATLLPAPAVAQAPANGDEPRPNTITVAGEGSVRRAPELARVRVGVTTEARTARAASEENARRMAAVVAALRSAGVPEERIQTVQLTVEPAYDYEQPQGRQVLRGFTARNVVEAATTDLEGLGALLDAAIQAGGNTIEGVTFDLEDPAAAQAEALGRAVADARRKAEALAAAAGVELGPVHEIAAVQAGPPQPWLSARVAAMDLQAAAPPPVNPGELTITANAQVVWRIGVDR
ncbi:MAG TPA: SIMPL domain-containing protein [Gemmatimonadota bacterium]|jgi:uncharacterized protein YggE